MDGAFRRGWGNCNFSSNFLIVVSICASFMLRTSSAVAKYPMSVEEL